MGKTDTLPVVVINLQKKQPIYLQITEQIVSAISLGSLKPRSRLPSVRQLAGDLQINMNTVAAAYKELEKMGVVRISHGLGVQVISQHSVETRSRDEMEQEITSLLGRWLLYGYSLPDIQNSIRTIISSWEGEHE